MIRKSLLLGAVLALSGTTYADITESNIFEYQYTNNSTGIYSPGGAGTVGTQRYDLYLQDMALGKTTAASSAHGAFSSSQAVDGNYSSYNSSAQNFFHASGSGTEWWKVNFAETAAGVNSVVIFDRQGFTGRLDNYQITIYDGDPDNGGTLVWSSDIYKTSTTPRKEFAVPENINGTWLKITNHVNGDGSGALTLPEVMVIGASENKAGVYGNQGEWLAPSFVSAGGSTLQIDLNFSGTTPAHDVLDVAGRYTAGGTLALNFLDTANIAAGDYQVVKAGSYAGSFSALSVSGLDSVNALITTGKLASEGKITVETDRIHWKEAPANTNFADTANWSSAPAGKDVWYGVYANSNANSQLNSAMNVNQLHMGYYAGSSGTLEVGEGGNLTAAHQLNIGESGTGVVSVNGGTLNYTRNAGATEGFMIGLNSGSNGTLNLTDGTVTTYGFTLGAHSGSTGTVNISGGTMTIHGGNNVRIGNNGSGVVNITGGTVNCGAAIMITDQYGDGSLSISDGTLNVSNQIAVGVRNPGSLNISGGVVDANLFTVGYSVTTSANGTVNQTGGTVTLKDGINFGNYSAKGKGTYNLSGGKLTAPTVKYGHTNTTAQFNISGTGEAVISGAVAVPTTLSGGTLTAGSITNTLTHSAGVFAPGGEGAYGTTTITGTYLSAADPNSNIARGCPASQVSNYNTTYVAGLATDGNYNAGGNFTHTNNSTGKNQWWQVMLGDEDIEIGGAVVYNRNLNNSTTLRLVEAGSGFHFELYSGTLENPGEMLERSETYDASNWSQGKQLNFNFENKGNILRIVRDFPENFTLSGNSYCLSLNEVEVLVDTAELQMDLKSDASAYDKIFIDGGTMDVSHLNLDLTIDDLLGVAPGTEWELFSTANDGTLVGDFASISLNDSDLTYAWGFENGVLTYFGTADQVPEPGTMVLLALGLGGLFLARRKR